MPINSGILSFGLVAIPVKLHPAIKDQTVRFHLLHSKCGSRVRNRLWCPVCNGAVERDGLVRGFEHSKGKYIQLTEEELDALEAEANRSIDLKEFVPVAKIDPVYFESALTTLARMKEERNHFGCWLRRWPGPNAQPWRNW